MTSTTDTAPADDAFLAVDEAMPDHGNAASTAYGDDMNRPGMIEQLNGLYQDGRSLVDAEIGFQRARLSAAGRQIRVMAALAFVGLVLLSCALIALTVGTMISLMALLGPWGAMGATVAGSLILAAICFWLAAGRIGRVTALFASDAPAEGEASTGSTSAGDTKAGDAKAGT